MVDEAMLQTVSRYKTLSSEIDNHHVLIKDKTMIQFLAYSLSSPDLQIITDSLETFYNLIIHERNQPALRSVFGVKEAIKSVLERNDVSDELKETANSIHEMLCSNTSTPLRNAVYTQDSTPVNKRKLSTRVTVLQVQGLSPDTRRELESILVKVRGVVSVVIDVETQRCVIRALQSVTPQLLGESIAKETDMIPRLVLRNKQNQEYLQNILHEEEETDSLPPYLEEEFEAPVIQENAVSTFESVKTNATGWLSAASSFIQNSFYW